MRLVVALLAVAALCSSAAAGATTYQSRVSAICRSYTPRLQSAETRLQQAKAAGDLHTSAYYLGVLMGATLAEGLKVEATPVPTALRARMARTLRLLHAADVALRTSLQRAVAGVAAGFRAGAATLGQIGPSLNASFDAVGLRACGSDQS